MCVHVCVWESKLNGYFLPLVQLLKSLWKPCFYTEGHRSEGVNVSCTSEVHAFASSGPFRYYIDPPHTHDLSAPTEGVLSFCLPSPDLLNTQRLAEPSLHMYHAGISTRWESVARFSTLKSIFRVLVQFPRSKRSSLGAAVPRGVRCWRRRCLLVWYHHLPAVLNFIWIEMKKERCSPADLS